ncbi:hypothetical protein AG0111_0g11277 [Alternaria gaisen]|uniref:Uncharacterized protein n=1 Tax=Alternaria gaisen TaxID=167740 RepID=A0ACB6F7B2_9PLEO|nr:hypothetical protein AG0111_0g11277 [Alternaria gaisen]
MNAYAYRALEGPEYIRLIVLHPALSKATPLRIDFVSSKLEDVEGDYDAVSYTWGEPVLTFPLYVGEDGMQVYVTENLDRALRYLRYETRERLLWADAACIDQKDNEEKAIQVSLMVQIFRGAKRVMAWLDPGGDTTIEQGGMHVLGRISRLSTFRTNEPHQDLSKVLQFLSLPWFNRLWIVQEVVFNVEVCLICGEMELPFSRLVSALAVVKRQDSWQDPGNMEKLDTIVEVGKLWNFYSLFREKRMEEVSLMKNTAQILHLLRKFELYECTDPRDRIFALCSMANDEKPIGYSRNTGGLYLKFLSTGTVRDRIRIDIDYSLDVRETYEAFALAHLVNTTNAHLIWIALLRRQHLPPPISWPSWVPDWRVPPEKIEQGHHFRYMDGSDCNVRKIATGILRVSISILRLMLDRNGKQFYTVNFKISKGTKGPQISFDSQLLQLYQMLHIPETVQGSHQLPIESASTPRKLNLTKFPDLLVSMIKRYVFSDNSYGIDRREEICSELEHYLSRMSIEPNLRDSSEPSSDDTRGFIEELAQALGNRSTLFCFSDPSTGVNSVGYGSVALELGDLLLPLRSRLRILSSTDPTADHVLILRPVYTMEALDGGKQIYKLVGGAYIFDPTAVLMSMEDKVQRLARQAALPFGSYRTKEKQQGKEEALFSSLGCQKFDQVVCLA